MDVSKQFEQIKNPLIHINETFTQLKELLNNYKASCQNSSKDLNELIGNKEILEKYEEEFVKLKEIRKEFLIIEEFMNKPSNFAFICIARIFVKINESLEFLNQRIGGKIHNLIEKYRFKELLKERKQEFFVILEGKMKEILKKMTGSELNDEQNDELIRILNCFEIFKETNKGLKEKKKEKKID